MVEKLRIKAIYDDFLRNVSLTDEQIRILNMLIKKETIVKISMEIGISVRTANYEIRKLKNIYEDYYDLQLSKTILLMK